MSLAQSVIYASALSDANNLISNGWPILLTLWAILRVVRKRFGVRWNESVLHTVQPQLDAILAELRINGGASLRDAVNSIDKKVDLLDRKVDDHIADMAEKGING